MTVTLISAPSCHGCVFTKRLLNERKIEFVERNIASDEEALVLAKSLGYSQAPVVILEDGTHWSGLDPDRIKAIVT